MCTYPGFWRCGLILSWKGGLSWSLIPWDAVWHVEMSFRCYVVVDWGFEVDRSGLCFSQPSAHPPLRLFTLCSGAFPFRPPIIQSCSLRPSVLSCSFLSTFDGDAQVPSFETQRAPKWEPSETTHVRTRARPYLHPRIYFGNGAAPSCFCGASSLRKFLHQRPANS